MIPPPPKAAAASEWSPQARPKRASGHKPGETSVVHVQRPSSAGARGYSSAVHLQGSVGNGGRGAVSALYAVSQSQYYRLRDRLLEGGKAGLVSNGKGAGRTAIETRIAQLERVAGRLTVENQALKKTLHGAATAL